MHYKKWWHMMSLRQCPKLVTVAKYILETGWWKHIIIWRLIGISRNFGKHDILYLKNRKKCKYKTSLSYRSAFQTTIIGVPSYFLNQAMYCPTIRKSSSFSFSLSEKWSRHLLIWFFSSFILYINKWNLHPI